MDDTVDAESERDRNNTATDNVICFERFRRDRTSSAHDGYGVDDDELLGRAASQINEWKSLPNLPSLTSVQQFFYELICADGSKMLCDKVIDAIIVAFNTKLGGKRALKSTWTHIEKEVTAERARAARARLDDACPPLTVEQKAASPSRTPASMRRGVS
jgi:hypothetical protein